MYKAGSVEYDAAAGAAGADAGAAGSGAEGSLGVAILSGPGMGGGGEFVEFFLSGGFLKLLDAVE